MSTPLVSLSELLAGTPEASLLSREVWQKVPPSFRSSYQAQAQHLASSWSEDKIDDVAAFRAVHALAWEIECLLQLLSDGCPMSSKALTIKRPETGAPRYRKDQDLGLPPHAPGERVRMQNDVPVWDEERSLPHWVETKCTFFRPYGQSYRPNNRFKDALDVGALNQLMKYQFALEQGWVSGACVIIRGRVQPRMWEWMTLGLDGHGTRIPGLEVLWDLPLPSGSSTLVQVKSGQGRSLAKAPKLEPGADKAVWAGFSEMAADPSRLRAVLEGGGLHGPGGDLESVDPCAIGEVPAARGYLDAWRKSVLASIGFDSQPRPQSMKRGA